VGSTPTARTTLLCAYRNHAGARLLKSSWGRAEVESHELQVTIHLQAVRHLQLRLAQLRTLIGFGDGVHRNFELVFLGRTHQNSYCSVINF